MPNYRRVWVPGGTYFFTVNLLERHRRLLVDRIVVLRAAFAAARSARPFDLVAMVVLPDHLHCIWTLPEGDADNAVRWAHLKASFSHALPPTELRSAVRIAKGERGIWQRRYWEHLIRDERDLAAHVDYVHFNPVKHGHVARVADWPYSTFHRSVARGVVPLDWSG
jgi:putative transposase